MLRTSRGRPTSAPRLWSPGEKNGRGASGRPRVVVTMGDPAGVGPEVAIKAMKNRVLAGQCELSFVGDPGAIERWADLLSIKLSGAVIDCGASAGETRPGRPAPEGARASLASIETAARLCLAGQADAMVTGPVSKEAIASTGVPFRGHTEFLARFTRADDAVMTFVHGERRVALVTTHLALRDVPSALSAELIEKKLSTLAEGLTSWLGVSEPRIAVTALNPHAGEGGRFGDEEERVIVPAIKRARDAGIDADGPHPADSVFVGHGDPEAGGPGSGYDAVLAMYHDQGTVAAKLWGFGRAVNLTLGLPIVRTSVDHRSMLAAIQLAVDIARRRQ